MEKTEKQEKELKVKETAGITMIALVITMVLHYYYCIKYSNFNGFLESNV